MKKIAKIIPLLFIVMFLASCGQRNIATDKPMDDGGIFYRNTSLNFSFIMPPAFELYQTQRLSDENYVDIEVFVPTSDVSFGQEVPGYAKPIVVRVFDLEYWDNSGQGANTVYRYIGEKNEKVYTIAFWDKIPSDWQENWNEEVKSTIFNSFDLE